jgi:hypothetical protein
LSSRRAVWMIMGRVRPAARLFSPTIVTLA